MGLMHSFFVTLVLATAAACTAETDLNGLTENSANSKTGTSSAADSKPPAPVPKADMNPSPDVGGTTQGTSANGYLPPGVGASPAGIPGSTNGSMDQTVGTGDIGSGTGTAEADGSNMGAASGSDAGAASGSDAGAAGGSDAGAAGDSSMGDAGSGTTQNNLRWMAMGDQPLAQLTQIAECTTTENIARSTCSTQNATCRSKFVLTCDTSSDCRRLFKCTTGTSSGLVWFAMGDTTAAGTFPQCTRTSNIAGSDCSTQNDRCLSSFLTATGNPRLFKCLPSGGPGLLFWRWIEDKASSDLASIATCPVRENVAGTSCSSENSRCKSQFCVAGTEPNCTRLRLFKCTP